MALALGPVKPHVQTAAEEVSSRFGITNIGGWRASGSVANSDHPKGLAIDIMTSDQGRGTMVAEWLVGNASRLSITYIIWYRRIWQNGTWQPYSGPSPHTDHVHVSFAPGPGDGSAPADGGGSADGSPRGCIQAFFELLNPLA